MKHCDVPTEMSDARTLAFYDEHAAGYAAREPHDRDVAALEAFMGLLPGGGLVCDLGCGNGWASATLIERGFAVTSMDGSAGLAAEAKALYGIDVCVSRFEDFAFRAAFDGVWACWSLHHAPRAAFPELLQRVAAGVKPGGVLFFSVKGGSGEDRDELERFYSYFTREELRDLIGRFLPGDIIAHESWEAPCFTGKATPLHHVFVRLHAGA